VILAGAGVGLAIWLDWWPAIMRAASGSTTVPNWLLAVLVLCAICVAGVVGTLVRVRFFEPPFPAGSAYHAYREDLVLGPRWRWQYVDDGRKGTVNRELSA
jgi:hypothetical protein